MDNFLTSITKKIQNLGSHWSTYTIVGSFALYILGYLTLRFHLTALGVGTDLSVIDERYLFAGTKFILYFLSLVPSLILLILLLVIPVYLPYQLLPLALKEKILAYCCRQWHRIHSWLRVSNHLVWLGIIFSLLIIQLVMRQCFMLTNLLLAEDLSFISLWLRSLLLSQNDWPMVLYFGGLLLSVLISLKIFYALDEAGGDGLRTLFVFLLSVQLLLLPVNYGVLVIDKSMPRVTKLNTPDILKPKQQAWLVWEGQESKTFLFREQKNNSYKKSLVTLSKKEIKRVDISSYDRIFVFLFSEKH